MGGLTKDGSRYSLSKIILIRRRAGADARGESEWGGWVGGREGLL